MNALSLEFKVAQKDVFVEFIRVVERGVQTKWLEFISPVHRWLPGQRRFERDTPISVLEMEGIIYFDTEEDYRDEVDRGS